MKFNILILFVAFEYINVLCESRHELEKELKVNLTWLNNNQIEVLHELKVDGYNISMLQNEMWLFYNNTKGLARKRAAKHIFKYCEDLFLGMADMESTKEWKKLLWEISTYYNPKNKILQFLNQTKQGTNSTKAISMNRCLPFIETESDVFVAKISLIGYIEEELLPAIEIYLLISPNNTHYLKKKATLLNAILKPEDANEVFDQILSFTPNNINIVQKKADTLITMERFDEAIKLFDKILELNSSNTETVNKKINAMLMLAQHISENASELIYETHFGSQLRWLNESQKRKIRRLKAEGKKSHELFTKLSEFFESSNETIKTSAIHSMEHGCIHLLYTVFGYEKAQELMDLKINFTADFDTKFKEFLKNLDNEGQARAANSYMPGCRKFLCFNDEAPPPIMVSFKINKIPVEFLYDTGADYTIANEKLWRKIGSPHLYPWSQLVQGVGGIVSTLGRCRVTVELHGKKKNEWLYIIKDSEFLVFGRNWVKSLHLKIEQ